MRHKIFLFLFLGLLNFVILEFNNPNINLTLLKISVKSVSAAEAEPGQEEPYTPPPSTQQPTKTTMEECLDECFRKLTEEQKRLGPSQSHIYNYNYQKCRAETCGEKISGFNSEDDKVFKYNIPIGGKTQFTINDSNRGRILGDFFNIWYGMLMGAIGVVATFMIAWGGFQYLSSRGDSTQIGNAKNTIVSAITGLILAFTSYLILSVISPNLLEFKDLKLDTVEGVASQGKDSHDNQPDSTGKYPIGADNRSTSTDATEDSIRRQLSEKGIGVNKKACPDGMAYQQVAGSCTSVAGLQPAVINEAIRLKNACNCNVMITGGTELGHHSSDRGYLVDFNKNTGLDSHITANSTQNGTVNWDGKTYNTYKVNGHTYVDEGDHWHVMINH